MVSSGKEIVMESSPRTYLFILGLHCPAVKMADETTVSLYPCAKDAYYLFQDLCLLTNNEPPEYLRLGRLSETFGLELIESVLTNHYTLFRKVIEKVLLPGLCTDPLSLAA